MKTDPQLIPKLQALGDTEATTLLTTLTRPRLRGTQPTEWSAEIGEQLLAEFGTEPTTASPGDMARQALLILAEDPDYAESLSALLEGPSPESFALDPVTGAALVTSVLFVLQSHVKFEKGKDGKTTFLFEKKPTDTALLKPLIAKLVAMLAGTPPTP